MRTTLEIEDEVLSIVKNVARDRDQSIGKAVSDLLRIAVTMRSADPATAPSSGNGKRNGIRLLSRNGASLPVTLDDVNRLRDGDPEPETREGSER
jgi:hypothetical protein